MQSGRCEPLEIPSDIRGPSPLLDQQFRGRYISLWLSNLPQFYPEASPSSLRAAVADDWQCPVRSELATKTLERNEDRRGTCNAVNDASKPLVLTVLVPQRANSRNR
jgi:hypothetical protein